MGTTDWHKKQGSGVLSFLREAFMLQCISARAASHNSVTELICKSSPCYLVYMKATNNYIIFNHKVTNFTNICGIYGLKTVKLAQNLKFRFYRKFSSKNGYKIVSEGPIDMYLVAKERSR